VIHALLLLGAGCSQPERSASAHSIEPPQVPGQHPDLRALEQLVVRELPEATQMDVDRVMKLATVRHEDLDQVMAFVSPRPGMVVADIGAGLGHFTFPLAEAVGPGGTVYALEVSSDLLAVLTARSRDPQLLGQGTVVPTLSQKRSTTLDDATLDLAFIGHLDHLAAPTIGDKEHQMISSIAQSTKPGGRVVVLQWLEAKNQPSSEAILEHFEAAELRLERVEHYPEWSSVIVEFRRPGGP